MTFVLPAGQSESLPWGEQVYRIGVHGDGSCFFHALLLCTDEEYHGFDDKKQKERAHAFRLGMAASVTLAKFIAPSSTGTPLYQDLPAQVKAYLQPSYELEADTLQQLEQELVKLHDTAPFRTFSEKELAEFVRLYLAFRAYLADPKQSVGDEIHELASQYCDCDIYITAQGDNYVYHDPSIVYQHRLSIIIYHVGDNHWEAVGQRVAGGLATSFDPDSVLIQQLRKYNENCWSRLIADDTQPSTRRRSRSRSGVAALTARSGRLE